MKKGIKLKVFLNKYLIYSLILLLGVFVGWIFFHPAGAGEMIHDHSSEAGIETIWTCSMHPQIRMEEPGKCPICGMDLILLSQGSASSVDPDAIHLSEEAAQLANVLTSVVSRQEPVKEVRLYGKIQVDERLLQSQVAHVSGRLEKLTVNFTGESVVKGQVLAEIYSPDLITAQQELLEAAKTKDKQPQIFEAAKEKLYQWKITDNQISAIESSGVVQNTVKVVSNTNGVVTSRRVNVGDYISQGTVLFEISDLSKVWILFDAYESDLQFLKKGEKVSYSMQAFPGNTYSGNIVFIDPVIDPVTRVAKVRVESGNQSGKLKPGMFATGIVYSNLDEYKGKFVIPRSAVLWTGKRSVVYIRVAGNQEPVFKIREIELGPVVGDNYVVMNGLNEGEEVVTSGTFSVDAAAQLLGKPSMMNPAGGEPNTMPGIDTSEKIEVSMDFTMQLNNVYEKYIILKNAFVKSDEKEVMNASREVQKTLLGVDMKLLSGDSHLRWMSIFNVLEKQIKIMSSGNGIEKQRAAFSTFNNSFFKGVKEFGLMGKTVYYQFCPMANENTGAYWLSENKEILNPYFGEAMLTCGETKETLNFNGVKSNQLGK